METKFKEKGIGVKSANTLTKKGADSKPSKKKCSSVLKVFDGLTQLRKIFGTYAMGNGD